MNFHMTRILPDFSETSHLMTAKFTSVGTETPQMLGVATSGVALQEKSSVQERQCAK